MSRISLKFFTLKDLLNKAKKALLMLQIRRVKKSFSQNMGTYSLKPFGELINFADPSSFSEKLFLKGR